MILTSFDNKEIYVREWKNVEEPRGVVQIAHGMNEYSGRYEAFAAYLNSLGYIVVASDHRGHGETDPETLGYWEGDMFDDTVKDLACVAKHYKEEYPDLKYILFGFSYGSFLSQRFIQKYARFLDGAILGGSSKNGWALAETGYLFASLGAKCKGGDAPARFVNQMIFGGYDKKMKGGEFLSVDEENNAKYHADPYCNYVCSNNFFRSFMKNMKKLYSKNWAGGLNPEMPLLLISGEDDAVGGMGKGTRKLYKFYRDCGMKNVTLHLLKGSRHEFLNEKSNRDEALSVISDFLRKI